jgi:hypothetical protein
MRQQNTRLIYGVSDALKQMSVNVDNQLEQASRGPIVIVLVQLPFGRSEGTKREQNC